MEYDIDFENIYNYSPDMCFSVEASTGKIVSCNQTLLDVLGYTKREVLGIPLLNFYHPDYHEKVRENFNSFSVNGTVIHTEFKLLKKSREIVEVSLQFTPVKDSTGKTLYSNAVWRDISKEKQIERDLIDEKSKVDKQKAIIEEKNNDILDSITYAKRIQCAILPSENNIKLSLPDSFLLYKPKDIVAGDFYWIEKIEDGLLFAVADCTGHGVPGALISLLCNSALNRSVREFKLTDTCKILDKSRELLIQEFETSELVVSDGMDIGLCKLVGKKLFYSGANNPLWLIRKGELLEFKGDKQAIGKSSAYEPFATKEIDLQEGDSFYIMSDGFQDQFGGPKAKKYKTRKLKEFLVSIHHHSMDRQQKLLEAEFENWKGSSFQVDDVCLMGVRV